MAHIRSQLARYRASGIRAIEPNSDIQPERIFWDIWLIPNRKEDRDNWLRMAASGGFTDIQLKKYKTDNTGFTTQVRQTTPKRAKTPEDIILANATIAKQGLEMLDALIAARRAKK